MTVLRSGLASDVGRVRTVNEDRGLQLPNLFAVADGMGGHVGGEVAARVAMETLRPAFDRARSADGLREAVVAANREVWRQSRARADLRGMGTTLTAAALVPTRDGGDDAIALANVGDSRAYVFSGGRLVQVTADHSLAEEKVRQGEMSEAQAAVHPHRHILTRALGVAADVDVDLWELHLRSGDRLLLCSDGLTNEIGADEIAGVLATVVDPEEAAEALVQAANEHGGNDNITVLVVDALVGTEQEGNGSTVVTPLRNVGSVGSGILSPASGDEGAGALRVRDGVADVQDAVARLSTATAEGFTGVVPAQPVPKSDDEQIGRAPPSVAEKVPKPAAGPEPEVKEPQRPLRAPRRITLRVLVFFVALAAVLGAAYLLVRWYATDNWYVALHGDRLVVYQGRAGGLLWFHPKVVDASNVTTHHVLPIRVPALRATVQEGSLAQAKQYIANLHREYLAQQFVNGGVPPTTTTAPPPPTTAPPIVKPST